MEVELFLCLIYVRCILKYSSTESKSVFLTYFLRLAHNYEEAETFMIDETNNKNISL